MEQPREGMESSEQGGGGCLFGSLSLSSLFIGGDWLGLRGGCSWASCNRPIGP
jgi:predicted small integral membrane protein